MTCQEALRAIDPYLDDELSVMETLRMQGHLIFCERCRKVMESEAALHSLIVADAVRDQAPVGLRARILRRISGGPSILHAPRSRPSWSVFARAWLAGIAGLGILLAVLVIPGARRPEEFTRLVGEVADKHLLYAASPSATLEMTTSETSRIAGWLEPRLGFPVKLPQFARPGERLVGGRVSSLADAAAAYLLYERDGRRLSLFITPRSSVPRVEGPSRVVDGVEFYTTTLRGINLVWWEDEDDDRLYAAASTAGVQDAVEFALLCVRSGRLRQAAERITLK